ncbi:MAG: decarboxylating NADP(+)-dependent phosphogluconate dehydrogenase [Phocaeicola sp.]|nr:decarboxylating NADP(+)-dependent phosphogluconate dehydrogenase [Phocaeicola sp.]
MEKADIGLIGLGVMGQNLALNLAGRGWKVVIWNRTLPGKEENVVADFMANRAKGKGIIGSNELTGFVEALKSPRVILLMVQAGAAVDELIDSLFPLLDKGDIIIDGGNSYFEDTERRVKTLYDKGMYFVGCGISGGEEGALHGASVMPGGAQEAWLIVRPILRSIAAKAEDGTPCCEWIGPGGAGHYVKMVHNGIEYGDMQLIAEIYYAMKHLLALKNEQMADVFEQWNKGRLHSYLIGITSAILRHKEQGGGYVVDNILDVAGQKGTGRWSVANSMELNMSLDVIAGAVFARNLSAEKNLRMLMANAYVHTENSPVYHYQDTVAGLETALYAARLTGYAQGFALMRAAGKRYGWKLDLSAIALLWRAGCIIRSAFLSDMAEAWRHTPDLPHLLLDKHFGQEVARALPVWKKYMGVMLKEGLAAPVLSAALNYYLGLTTRHSSANLIQAMRDYFGAHTFERVDSLRGEFFHEHWE